MECSHDELEIVKYVEDSLGMDGHTEIEQYGYECVNCGKTVDYDIDTSEAEAEAQLMDMLGK